MSKLLYKRITKDIENLNKGSEWQVTAEPDPDNI